MKRSPKTTRHLIIVVLSFAALASTPLASAGADESQVECTTPDGQVISIPQAAAAAAKNSPAFLTADDRLSCPLREGQTTFVIKLPAVPLRERFTVVNENASVAGELKISVSNDPLPAASPKWVDVDGAIAFNHKRLFNVSMVGVEARYLRLAFKVAKIAGQSVAHQSPITATQDLQTLLERPGLPRLAGDWFP